MMQSLLDKIAGDWRLNLAVAGLLAAAGLLINQWQLTLSWGLQLTGGCALIYTFARCLRPAALIGAIGIASLSLILQGQSPWLWVLVTTEAGAIAFFCQKRSPIIIDLAFWLTIAGLTALELGFDATYFPANFGLTVGGQAIASFVSVIMGELAYTILIIAFRNSYQPLNRLSMESLILSALMALVGIPKAILHEIFINSDKVIIIYNKINIYYLLNLSNNNNSFLNPLLNSNASIAMAWMQVSRVAMLLVFLTAAGIALGYWAQSILSRIATSARTISGIHSRLERINKLVIEEMEDVSESFVLAGAEVGNLSRDQRRLSAIAKHAPVVLYAMEIEDGVAGVPIYISPSADRMLGWAQAEMQDRAWWSENIHPDDLAHWTASFSDLRQGLTRRSEYRLRRADGKYLWVYDTLAVDFDPITGRPEGVGVIMDISERKFVMNQLVEAEKMASLGRVLAGVTHEINQPLNFIKIAMFNLRHLVTKVPQDLGQVMQKLDSIAANVDHAASIVLQMRVFGRAPLQAKEPTPFSDVIAGLLLMIESQLKLDRISIDTTDCIIGAERIEEPKLLGQVLLNLLINGRDAIAERMATGDTAPGKLKVSASRHEGDLVITVEDNGTGIPDAVLSTLFEPFFTTKSATRGTGLGLSISYGIIHDMGGLLTAGNAPDGARFTITIPAMLQ